MADIIVISVIAIAAFFILRGQIRRFRGGQCSGGCAGCAGCTGSCCQNTELQTKKVKKQR